MCTISFIARKQGYLLAMNRDEKLTRARGQPPRIFSTDGREVICPGEAGTGTWIALNDASVTFALVNWYPVKAVVKARPVSRGHVVHSVAAQLSPETASRILAKLPLAQINPFRLVGIFPQRREVFEWRWDLTKLEGEQRPWQSQQWISSGFDEPQAQRIRSKSFQLALRQKSAGNLDWLRRLHRSHAPTPGPFSTCMHRADAATVSYTEIVATKRQARMAYCPEAPCQCVMRSSQPKLLPSVT